MEAATGPPSSARADREVLGLLITAQRETVTIWLGERRCLAVFDRPALRQWLADQLSAVDGPLVPLAVDDLTWSAANGAIRVSVDTVQGRLVDEWPLSGRDVRRVREWI